MGLFSKKREISHPTASDPSIAYLQFKLAEIEKFITAFEYTEALDQIGALNEDCTISKPPAVQHQLNALLHLCMQMRIIELSLTIIQSLIARQNFDDALKLSNRLHAKIYSHNFPRERLPRKVYLDFLATHRDLIQKME